MKYQVQCTLYGNTIGEISVEAKNPAEASVKAGNAVNMVCHTCSVDPSALPLVEYTMEDEKGRTYDSHGSLTGPGKNKRNLFSF